MVTDASPKILQDPPDIHRAVCCRVLQCAANATISSTFITLPCHADLQHICNTSALQHICNTSATALHCNTSAWHGRSATHLQHICTATHLQHICNTSALQHICVARQICNTSATHLHCNTRRIRSTLQVLRMRRLASPSSPCRATQMCCSVLRCVALCCAVLCCGAVCCRV